MTVSALNDYMLKSKQCELESSLNSVVECANTSPEID